MTLPGEITGEDYHDKRGKLRFFNDFNMHPIRRFYEISPSDQTQIRAWQGHAKESKWFYCNSGGFVINLVKVDDFNNPSRDLLPERFELLSDSPAILEVPAGYATGIKAISSFSVLTVYSDSYLKNSIEDDYRFPEHYWKAKW